MLCPFLHWGIISSPAAANNAINGIAGTANLACAKGPTRSIRYKMENKQTHMALDFRYNHNPMRKKARKTSLKDLSVNFHGGLTKLLATACQSPASSERHVL